jgi:hypothetical protein
MSPTTSGSNWGALAASRLTTESLAAFRVGIERQCEKIAFLPSYRSWLKIIDAFVCAFVSSFYWAVTKSMPFACPSPDMIGASTPVAVLRLASCVGAELYALPGLNAPSTRYT